MVDVDSLDTTLVDLTTDSWNSSDPRPPPIEVPKPLDTLFQHVQSHPALGLFRISGSTKRISSLFNVLSNLPYNSRELLLMVDEAECNDRDNSFTIHDYCGCLKRLLYACYPQMLSSRLIYRLTSQNRINDTQYVIAQLHTPNNHSQMFLYLMLQLHLLVQNNTEITKMTAHNYAIVFQPLFFNCHTSETMANATGLLESLILNAPQVISDYYHYKPSLEEIEESCSSDEEFHDVEIPINMGNFQNNSMEKLSQTTFNNYSKLRRKSLIRLFKSSDSIDKQPQLPVYSEHSIPGFHSTYYQLPDIPASPRESLVPPLVAPKRRISFFEKGNKSKNRLSISSPVGVRVQSLPTLPLTPTSPTTSYKTQPPCLETITSSHEDFGRRSSSSGDYNYKSSPTVDRSSKRFSFFGGNSLRYSSAGSVVDTVATPKEFTESRTKTSTSSRRNSWFDVNRRFSLK